MALLKVTRLEAADARPGDVVLDKDGAEWKRGPERHDWSTFDGPVTYEGPWKDEYGPLGELTLLVRGGRPQVAAAGPVVDKPA